MDHEGMNILASMTAVHSSAHHEFTKYLTRTGNTICGRHPIGVLSAAVESLSERTSESRLKWVRYEQSSPCETIEDSSVSYASAYLIV
jgi:MEMO1 family protein